MDYIKNKNLYIAKKEKRDEFYTQFSDIEKEIVNYDLSIFKNKIIYCPMDIVYVQGKLLSSEFVHYFQLNAKRLGFKKLIATCLVDKKDNLDVIYNKLEFYRYLRPECNPKNPFYNSYKQKYYSEDLPDEIEYYDDIEGTKLYDKEVQNVSNQTYKSRFVIMVLLSQCKSDEDNKYESGDFRSKFCTDILKISDIVITNPPFSLFREFIDWLLKYDKDFLILGNLNAVTYKEVFPLIKDNKIWYGASIHSGDRKFVVPNEYPLNASGWGIDEKGNRYIKVKGVRWFTNLKYNSCYRELILTENYYENDGVTLLRDSEKKYPKYDNYNAIEVSKVKNIPKDYKGLMGVPITFLDRYNPEIFEIIAFANGNFCSNSSKDLKVFVSYVNGMKDKGGCPLIKGKLIYPRILIRRKNEEL